MTLNRIEAREAAAQDAYLCKTCGRMLSITHFTKKFSVNDDLFVTTICLECREAKPQPFDQPTLLDVAPTPYRVTKAGGDEIPRDEVTEIFEYWRTARGKNAAVMLTRARRLKILGALRSFDVDTIKAAIDGIANSDFHMGKNSYGRVYDDLVVILRDQSQVEKFSQLRPRPALDPEQLF